MNTDKAYLFGLLVGGGRLGGDSLSVVFPYKQWGEITQNPERAGCIAKDILTKVQPVFRNEYKMDVFYKTQPNWRIHTSNLTPEFKEDLEKYSLPLSGDVRETADIENLIQTMTKGSKRAFVAGLADAIGSLAPSHRRFSSNYQIISFEFKGKNFKLVADIIKILRDIDCIPDQILWNHPNQHSGTDRYYKDWRKGFKIRVALDDYVVNASFAFQAKTESATENISLQGGKNWEGKNKTKKIVVEGLKTVHVDENSPWIPEEIRGYHFIHNQHLAAALGCEFVSREDLLKQLARAADFINPFTILTKGTAREIKDIMKSEEIMSNRKYREFEPQIKNLLRLYRKDSNALVYGLNDEAGYPVSEVLQGIAFVAGQASGSGVKGKRVLGHFVELIEKLLQSGINVKILVPDLLTPLVVTDEKYSALVGPNNSGVYKDLIIREGDFLLKVRPIVEQDLKR